MQQYLQNQGETSWFYRITGVLLAFFMIGTNACQKTPPTKIEPRLTELGYYELPPGFPAVEEPADNKGTIARVRLGKRLFFDPILSSDYTVSCASCHEPKLAFSDNTPLSFGVGNRAGPQNSPSLTNVAYLPYLTRAGGVPTLEMQVLVPLQEVHELNLNIVLAAKRLQADSLYTAWSQEAYQRDPDHYVITRALAAFERTLISANSPYDHYHYYNEETALSSAARRGKDLFMSSKTSCSTCHEPPHFSDFSFKNNGLHETYADSGRIRLTLLESDRDLFRVPMLRNVGLSAPYMHDGSLNSLAEVIEHYDKGGAHHSQKDASVRPLGLSNREKKDLEAFLRALTDETFTNNSAFLPD